MRISGAKDTTPSSKVEAVSCFFTVLLQSISCQRNFHLPKAFLVCRNFVVSLPAISKTRQTSLALPSKEGEAPKVQFVARHNLRPRPPRLPIKGVDDLSLTGSASFESLEKRKTQYKQLKLHESVDFVSWNERDDAWRTKRLANYMSSSKLARETSLFKKRKRKFLFAY